MSAVNEVDAHAIVGATAPDYAFTFEAHPQRVRAVVGGVTVADSDAVMVLEETRLDPVYYFPRRHVRMDLMRRTDRLTHCPFKGNASYWSLELEDRRIENILWGYEDPLPEAAAIGGYVAFYPELVDQWFEGDRAIEGRPGDGASHFTNPLLAWLIREAPQAANAVDLTHDFANRMRAAGIPLWRLNIVIRTLHPQVMALAYRWWLKNDEVESIPISYELLQSTRFQDSPLVPIFEGAGGIRRRLEGTDPALDYPILRDLHAEGGTDYVAMPMVFSDGQINAVTLATTRPGGFGTAELGHVYEVLAVLGRLYEVHALRYRADTLMDTYLGRHAGARVLRGVIKRGDGEDIEAVIWFCDLRESTPLARSMSRGDFLALLNSFFDCMAGAVIDHGGEVLRFIGDAALGIFPIDAAAGEASARDARERALAAAGDARARIAAVNAARESEGLAPVRFGIGLHPGLVTYGNIGTATRLEFTVIGDAANVAARVESMCKRLGREVLVSADFARHFPERFESLGEHVLAGVDAPVELFALRG